MIEKILRTEPVRLYHIAVAAVALGAYFAPSDGWPLVIALIVAILGVGEGVRTQVWSQASHDQAVEHAPKRDAHGRFTS